LSKTIFLDVLRVVHPKSGLISKSIFWTIPILPFTVHGSKNGWMRLSWERKYWPASGSVYFMSYRERLGHFQKGTLFHDPSQSIHDINKNPKLNSKVYAKYSKTKRVEEERRFHIKKQGLKQANTSMSHDSLLSPFFVRLGSFLRTQTWRNYKEV